MLNLIKSLFKKHPIKKESVITTTQILANAITMQAFQSGSKTYYQKG